MTAIKPLIFNSERPYDHFNEAKIRKHKIDRILNYNYVFGIILVVLAFPAIFMRYNLIAWFFLFNIIVFGSFIAASYKKAGIVPFGGISAVIMGMLLASEGFWFNGLLYFFMAAFQMAVYNAIADDKYLASLFGYPHFSAALAEAPQATLEVHNAVKMPSDEDIVKDKRQKITTQNTNGVKVFQSSEMDCISIEDTKSLAQKPDVKKSAPIAADKTSFVEKKLDFNPVNKIEEKSESPILPITPAADTDVYSLEKPPEPTAPPVFDAKEYSASVEAEIKSSTESFSYSAMLKEPESEPEPKEEHPVLQKKETYSDYMDKKSILLADKSIENTDDLDLLF